MGIRLSTKEALSLGEMPLPKLSFSFSDEFSSAWASIFSNGAAEPTPPTRSCSIAQPANHVEVDHGDDVLKRDGRMIDEVFRADQALLLLR